MKNADSSLETFRKAVIFSWQVYCFYLSHLPNGTAFSGGGKIRCGSVEFENQTHLEGYKVELGWAFFVRIEAVLEAHINRLNIKNVLNVIKNCPSLSQVDKNQYAAARELRNILHDGDGDHHLLRKPPERFNTSEVHEPSVLPEDMHAYAELFLKIAKVLDANA